MADISAALVRTLREQTGAGMMDCKKALVECGGDLGQASDWLRKKGLSAASRKAGRVTAEGLVAVVASGASAAVVEVNAETDFVGRNDLFQDYVRHVAQGVLETGLDLQALSGNTCAAWGKTFGEELVHRIAVIGENLTLRRSARVQVEAGVVATYMHNETAPGLGRIGVLVALEGPASEALVTLGRQIAMHVAACAPQALSVDELDPAVVARERALLEEQAASQAAGRPADVVSKMVEGRLRKFCQEVVLLEQNFVMDPQKTVRQVVEDFGKTCGAPVKLRHYVRFALGEGIEKIQTDFAQEVAAQLA